MEDNQESLMKTSLIITGEVNKIRTPGAAEDPSSAENGFVPTAVKVETEIDEDSAAKEFQELLLKQEIMEDESMMQYGSIDEDRKGVQMEVDQVHVMENDLEGGAVPLFVGDKTPSKTASGFPNNPTEVEVENSSINGEAEMSNEETVSSSSFASPNGFSETNGKGGNPNGRVSSDSNCKSGPENALQVNKLEEQVKELHDLLILKEKEWNVILRLKKHTEHVLEKVKYDQRRAKAESDFDRTIPMTDDDKNTWMRLITTNTIDTLKSAEQKIKDSTEKFKSRHVVMEKAFPHGSFTASTPRSSLKGRDSIEAGVNNSFVGATYKPNVNSKNKVIIKQKPTLKPAPKSPPASKSLASSPSTASQAQRMNAAADLRPLMRTIRDIAANKNKLKSNTVFKPVRMTGADRRFRYQKVIEKLKVEANKLRKAANPSGNHTRPAVQQSARSKPSRQPTQQSASGERPVVVTFSTGERNVVNQQNYRQETAVPVPICQGCHAAPSEYMCSLCKDQWYCSRECQLKDWGEHSEFCS